MKLRFKWMLIGLLLLMSAGLVACSSGDSGADAGESDSENGDVTLRFAWWGGEERHDITNEAIALFEEENPGITIEPEYTSWDNYWERLTTQAAGENLPDIIQMDNSKTNEYVSRDLIVDLQPYIEDGTINMENVDDVYQDMLTEGDSVWAISGGSNALGSVENQELMEEHGIELEPGYTYEDLRQAMLEMKDAIGDDFHGFDFNGAEYEMFYVYARQNEEAMFNEEGNGLGFSDETLVGFLDFVKTMVDEGAAPPHALAAEYTEGGESLTAEGMAASSMAASNGIIGLSRMSDYELDLNVLPQLEGGVEGNWVRPSMSFTISTHSEEQEAAAKFINFLTNNVEANEILSAERGVPISSEVREAIADQVEEPIRKTFDYLELVTEYSRPADPLPPAGESEVRGSFQRLIEQVKADQVTPEEAAEQFRQEAEQVLQ